MKIGTWKVRSLFWSGALKVLHNELSYLDFDVVVLQETVLLLVVQIWFDIIVFSTVHIIR